MNEQTAFDRFQTTEKGDEGDPWAELLNLVKKIKDAVHRSIWLTQVEMSILDSKEFQRLRHIKQTGPAYLLYPTATHTRFDHSIGAVHVAQQMADSINKSTRLPPLTNRDIFLIRIVALLHDLVHLPFGHSLEDEGRLFAKKQWQSPMRQQLFFRPVADAIKQNILLAFREAGKTADGNREADRALEEIRQILIAEEDGKVEELDSPYIADIVGNTVCADLLDYIKRDLFFCGLSGGYDELIFFYMTIGQVEGKRRLVIRLFKPGKKEVEIRPDVLTALVDLLRLRYSIGERVYYHHTKREASAMVIKMVSAAMRAEHLDEQKLCELGDDSLLYYLRKIESLNGASRANTDHAIAKKLEDCLSRRALYKPVYELSMVDFSNSLKVNELISDWRKRYETEEMLCELLQLEPGEIIIYVPSENMGSKQAKAFVQTPFPFDGSNDICRLKELAEKRVQDPNLQDVIDVLKTELNALEDKHRVLWKLSVFVHPKVRGTEKAVILREVCESWFKNQSQHELVQLLAERLSLQLSATEISALNQQAQGIVYSSDSLSESSEKALLARYCSTIRTVLQAKSVAK